MPGKKKGESHKRNRATYKAEGRLIKNKLRREKKELRKLEKLELKKEIRGYVNAIEKLGGSELNHKGLSLETQRNLLEYHLQETKALKEKVSELIEDIKAEGMTPISLDGMSLETQQEALTIQLYNGGN